MIKGSTDSTSIQSSDSFQLLSEHSQFSKRSVEQLGLIKEADILLSLSDGVVRLHDSREYSLIEQLTRSKGASQFALTTISKSDPESGIPSIVSRLAVAVKRRILFWTWRDTQFDVDPVEMSLESSVRSMTWIEGLNLVCGLNSGFVLVDSETQGAHDINYQRPQSDRPNEVETERFGAQGATMSYIGMSGWTPPTLATQLGQNEVLLARDVNSYFINTSGKPLGRRSIPWITAPDEIAYSYPYLLSAFFSRSTIEVRNPDTLSVLQTISLPSARFLQVPQSSLSLAHAAKGCYIVGDKHVWQLNAENYNSQVDSLSAARKWDEALSLLSMLEDALVTNKAQKLQAIQTEKATDMFRRKEYRKALELFTVAQTDPYTVIRLYPPEISGDAADSDQDPPEQKSLSEIDGMSPRFQVLQQHLHGLSAN